MQAITHYEVYESASGQWALSARFSGSEQQTAMAHARGIEEAKQRAVAVIEETESLVNSQFDIRMIYRTLLGGMTIRPPAPTSDIGSRMLMVILTGVAIGAMVTAIVGIFVSGSGAGGGFFKMIMLGSFFMGAIMGSSLLFRMYIPVGLVLWNAKDPESRKRTIMTLAHGTVVPPVSELSSGPSPDAPATEADPLPSAGGDFQSGMGTIPPAPERNAPAASPGAATETTAPAPTQSAPPSPVPTSVAADAGATAMDSLIARNRALLEAFADQAMAEVTAAKAMLMPPERQAVSVYLAGAAQGVADRNVLDEVTTVTLVRHVLERSGLSSADTETFLHELAGELERPKFRRVIEAGAAALAERIDNPEAIPSPSLTELIDSWNAPDASAGAGAPQQVTFLLTDIVGSTALTSQIGNAGAQRVVRAHNAMCRAAAKAFRGREVKHTGDGMLLVFPDPTAGAKAAMNIQQEATAFAQDNPTAPLVLRVGVHVGDAVFEDGEYYGTAVSVVNGVTAVVDGGEICCSAAVRNKVGTAFRFEDLGLRTVKGSPTGIEVSKLLWEAKRPTGPGVLEYRQIGTAPGSQP
jgi:class 3 adenylate cyclase